MGSIIKNPQTILRDYQGDWVNDKSRFKVGMWARQVGKTFTTALEIALDILEKEVKGETTTWIIGSASERQAKLALEPVKAHLDAMKLVFEDEKEVFKDEFLNTEYTVLGVRFKSGSKVIAIPANPSTVRGFTGNVYLDEFAFHENSREIWGALFPIVSANKNYRLIITSTPNGKGNKFYELMTGNKGNWSKHAIDIYKAVEGGSPQDITELKENLNDPEAWAQEFELKWMETAESWLSFDLITSAEHQNAGDYKAYQGGDVFIGNDIAARGDLWVAWINERIGEKLVTREVVTKKNISFAEQDTIMDNLFNKYKVIKLAIDQTGMGEKPVEDAKRRYGNHRVEGVLFSAKKKLEVATVAKKRFEGGEILIPQGDADIRADLHSIKRTTGQTGTPRLVAARENGSHADRAWACFLALYAAQSDYQPYKSHDVNRHMQGQRSTSLSAGFSKFKGAL